MKPSILAAVLLAVCTGTACAQTPPPPPAQTPMTTAEAPNVPPPGVAPAMPPGMVPPLPPGCATNAPPPPAPPTPAFNTQNTLATGLNIDAQQAGQVQAVLREQGEQAQRIDQQRRDLDASTCRKLHGILGDQGLARWMSLAPPPPPPGAPGMAPPPPVR